jgi:hypothetical protein
MPLVRVQIPKSYWSGMALLKKLFWAYFLLLIFEGALRKWLLPQLSAPLLLVRDPIGLLIIWEAYRANKWPEKWSAVTGALAAGLVGLCVIQMVMVDNPFPAAIYGLRSYLLPFPIAFIMGENLDEEDLRRFGVCTLLLLLPLTLLEVAQYLAPANSFLNAGAYAGAQQIAYAGSHTRASGTFSFVTGPISYGPMAAAFIFYGLVNDKFAKKWLVWAATFALILSVPVIGARSLVFELGAVAGCAGIAAISGVSQFFKSLKIIVPLLVVSFLVSLLPIFTQASSTLNERFAMAAAGEGGLRRSLEERTYGTFVERIEQTDFHNHPIGIGMGQGAAAISRLALGRAGFVAGEDEISRETTELGAIPGIAFALFRIFLTVVIAASAIARARNQEPFALLMIPLVFSTLTLGTMEQPTEQGFMVMALGFSLAALKSTHPIARLAPAVINLPRPVRFGSLNR